MTNKVWEKQYVNQRQELNQFPPNAGTTENVTIVRAINYISTDAMMT
jgi:hypothetical protein